MTDLVVKYLTGELDENEKETFLSMVRENKILKKELMEFYCLLACLSSIPGERDKANAGIKLKELMLRIEKKV